MVDLAGRLFWLIIVSGLILMEPACSQGASVSSNEILAIRPGIANVPEDGPLEPDMNDLGTRIAQAREYCGQNGFNDECAFFIDLGLHSATNRFFVVRLSDGKIQFRGLVTHGSGKKYLEAGFREYSNTNGSLLSALGKYKTGRSYMGQFGLAYKLFGLDSTNNNAFKRAIVLHAHECVPDLPFNGMHCQSWGCPAVSVNFLRKLSGLIESSSKPILLWVYDTASITD